MSFDASPPSGGVRFAPSPTGRFHVGNLRTAWISERWARALGLKWVVRFEDIDRPRVISGAQESQIADMRALGLEADLVLLQSRFRERHAALFEAAVLSGKVYPCDCSRKDVHAALATLASAPHGTPPVYSGRCRALPPTRKPEAIDSVAWRFKMPNTTGQDDFIVARSAKDLDSRGLPERATYTPAYHWACAIDDHDGAYELLVRSSDLASAGALQRAIQTWLSSFEGRELKRPRVFLTSLIVQNDGHRLEKRTQGVTLDELRLHGIDATRLGQIFAESFDSSWLKKSLTSFDVISEARETMTMHELGIEI